MNTRRLMYAVAASLLVFPAAGFAGDRDRGHGHGHGHGGYDKAKVIDVEPITRSVRVSTPRRDCWDEEVTYYDRHESATPVLIGGIIGGVIGNQFGGGNGKKAATVAGTLLGASMGHDSSRRNAYAQPVTATQQHCQVSHDSYLEERISGYHVTYRYKGETYQTRMDHDPGDWVRVRMRVDVID